MAPLSLRASNFMKKLILKIKMFWKRILLWLGIAGIAVIGAVTLAPDQIPNLPAEELKGVQKVYDIDRMTKADADTRVKGVYWGKISPNRALIDKLILDGYLEWKPRYGRDFEAVWFTDKAITEQKARIKLEKDAEKATELVPKKMATSTP